MLSAGFEPAIPGIKRLQAYYLDRMVTVISYINVCRDYNKASDL
jgi:hypothetical protein